jgi:hypothetical protein
VTLLVGINLGSYVVMGADTRVSWYTPDGEFRFHDEGEKIQKTDIGLITGAGLINILDPVKKMLAHKEVVTHTRRIEALMRDTRNRFRDDHDWTDQPHVIEALAHTCWLFTYFGSDTASARAQGNVTLRLALAHPSSDYNRDVIATNSAVVVMPTGSTENQVDALHRVVNEHIAPLESASDFVKNVNYHVGLIAGAMEAVAGFNQGVTQTFQVGIHTADFRFAISPIISDRMWRIELRSFFEGET